MKKLLLSLMAFLLCINLDAKHNQGPIEVDKKGGWGVISTNPVSIMQNGNVLTTTFYMDTHATVVVSKATARYGTYSISINSEGYEEVVSTQTVDAKEFDEVITTIENYEIGVKYIIEIITPEGTLVGEFEITE